MAKVTLMPSGINASVPSPHKRSPGLRGKCTGWSPGACRRNARFLRSARIDKLPRIGITLTLTVRDLPASAHEWSRIRNLWLNRVRASGAICFHWVTEWTRRGVPHLHAVVFYDLRHWNENWTLQWDLTDEWTAITAHLGSGPQGQCAKKMTEASGWFQYVAKHSARGAAHYQRQMASLPDTWDTVGRVWGKGGDWETSEIDVDVSMEVFHQLRRLVRGWLVAQARSDLARERRYGKAKRIEAAERRIVHAAGMLRCHKRGLSTVRGLGHWVNGDAQEELLSAAWQVAAWKQVADLKIDLAPIGQVPPSGGEGGENTATGAMGAF